jgi:putative ABC transport system ATP-binding protein
VSGFTLQGTDLVVERAGRRILDQASLTVAGGERVAVTGPSGAGKTTLLHVLAGLERPDRGRVRVGATRRVGIVFQGHGLVSLLTAAENVELALQAERLARAEVRRRAAAALAEVGLGPGQDRLVEELSSGQQQRVAVARALVVRPDVLLADEPTAELDAGTREAVLELLLAAADDGAAVVLGTHDLNLADRCDRQVRMLAGRLYGAGRA